MTMTNFTRIVYIFSVYLFYTTAKCNGTFIEDYCWRDYDGVAPTDAFKGGVARDGKPIYIGQTLFDNKLIPGKIHEDANEIHVEFHHVHTLNETIKILCTDYPEKFEWFKTRTSEVFDIKDKHIFDGGFEKGYITYIGRTLSHGELTVGKVICFVKPHETGCFKLTTIENGKWYDHDEFEILSYNPDAKESSTNSSSTSHPPPAKAGYNSKAPNKPGFLSYFFLALVVGGLIVLVVVLLRRC